MARGVAAFLQALRDDDLAPVEGFIAETVAWRAESGVSLGALHEGFAVLGELFLPLLRACYGEDSERILEALERLQALKDGMLTALVAQDERRSRAASRAEVARLQARQAELEQRLVQVDARLQTLQGFNERILQSMTSGLLVADKESHRILKVNRAMERLGRFRAADVMGRTVEDVFAGYRGLPIGEFADEVGRHGTITLRKHRLMAPDGREVYRTIKGEVFYDQRGEDRGVIVIIDDISTTEFLRETFSRYLSPQVLDRVLACPQRPALQSARGELSVLFADMRDFSRFAERHAPEVVVELLNRYFDVMVEVLFAYGGTLDKFLGDGLLAFFGMPLPQSDHPQRAVQAALAMQRAVAEVNAGRRQHGAPCLDLGIGINSGEAIVGTIGSEKRMEYTVVGDMVNVAQRLQAHARGGEVLISDAVFTRVAPAVAVRETLDARLKGRRHPVRAHRIAAVGAAEI